MYLCAINYLMHSAKHSSERLLQQLFLASPCGVVGALLKPKVLKFFTRTSCKLLLICELRWLLIIVSGSDDNFLTLAFSFPGEAMG